MRILAIDDERPALNLLTDTLKELLPDAESRRCVMHRTSMRSRTKRNLMPRSSTSRSGRSTASGLR